jgi:hypothetical protein
VPGQELNEALPDAARGAEDGDGNAAVIVRLGEVHLMSSFSFDPLLGLA